MSGSDDQRDFYHGTFTDGPPTSWMADQGRMAAETQRELDDFYRRTRINRGSRAIPGSRPKSGGSAVNTIVFALLLTVFGVMLFGNLGAVVLSGILLAAGWRLSRHVPDIYRTIILTRAGRYTLLAGLVIVALIALVSASKADQGTSFSSALSECELSTPERHNPPGLTCHVSAENRSWLPGLAVSA